jgi:S-adenosylhomocysteine hydrolase
VGQVAAESYRLAPGLYAVPPEIDERVARLKLPRSGYGSTRSTTRSGATRTTGCSALPSRAG